MWNISKKAREFQRADAIVVSIPTSGRTWMRVFLHAYFAEISDTEFDWHAHKTVNKTFPLVLFTHDLWAHRHTTSTWRRWRGRNRIPDDLRHNKKIILLARDPRDVMVSLYFQLSKRENRFIGEMDVFLKHPKFGIESVVGIMNEWIDQWWGKPTFKLIRYEDCRRDPHREFASLLEFIGDIALDDELVAKSLEFASFEKMKNLEKSKHVESKSLRPSDDNDPDSFKVRRGKVGGYKDYLDAADQAYLESAIAGLDTRFGYQQVARTD